VLNEHNTVFARKRSAICNRCFPGPTRVLDTKDISIASAVLQGSLGDKPTDRPTDHGTRSVTIGDWLTLGGVIAERVKAVLLVHR